MYSKLFSESLIMMREALEYPTMYNKQNTTVKTKPHSAVPLLWDSINVYQ